jgi:hypothetical protein
MLATSGLTVNVLLGIVALPTARRWELPTVRQTKLAYDQDTLRRQ